LALPYQWQVRIERWKNAVSGLFGGGNEPPRPKMCPSCGSLVGINTTRCHQCGTSLTFSMAALTKRISGYFGDTEAPVTTVLLIMNVLMFGVSWVAASSNGGGGGLSILWSLGGASQYRLGSSYGPAIFGHDEYYRLITAMFLHGGLLHIGFNMMGLMQFGPALEELYGSARYLFLYVFTGAFGFLFSSFMGNLSLGASGALLGLIGAMLAVTSKRGGSYMKEMRARLITSVVILFALGFGGMGLGAGMDNSAHFAGLASGFGLGKLFADRQPMNAREHQVANVLGWLSALAVVGSFVLMIMHYHDPLPVR